MLDIKPKHPQAPCIAVFGVGGCGCNTINQLSQSSLSDNVVLIAVNTDAQSLAVSACSSRLQIGTEVTKGLGAGADPQKGYAAAQESEEQLREHIQQADVIFITGGMGGGTGTGAVPFIASLAAELNKPLVAVVTTPFSFEGLQRNQLAKEGIDNLMQHASAVIVLPNDKLAKTLDKKITLVNAFFESNRILQDVLAGLTTIISQSGLINIDLNDFITVVSHRGRAAMGVARQAADEELQHTINKSLKNPLLEDIDLTSAKGAIVSVMATEQIELSQYHKIGEILQQALADKAVVIIGLTIVPELESELELMVIATGIGDKEANKEEKEAASGIGDTLASNTDERFGQSELLNLHDFLAEKSQNPQTTSYSSSEFDTPTITRRSPNRVFKRCLNDGAA
ncbi:Cell division protein FtsZ [Shewanella sp. P1-14-1]|uniref:cell division protein FtsZ n=1 Tax=Shewanella sp. P1-14-1 TaxID=1723761 RepID=UPI0006D67E29|nr:cell division protein FtsZ [Shewanella sp. P1-14-1]KPZ69707.1 Cell division protein FtsZ [Shewanella sp. P1-14-1]